jgi:hypothetical protein
MDTIQFKGGDSAASILTSFGKVIDKASRKIDLRFEFVSSLAKRKAAARVSEEDKALAKASLTPAELAALAAAAVVQAKLDSLAKGFAEKRVAGEMSDVWTIAGTVAKL